MSPVPLGVQIAQLEALHLVQVDFGHAAGNLTGDKRLTWAEQTTDVNVGRWLGFDCCLPILFEQLCTVSNSRYFTEHK